MKLTISTPNGDSTMIPKLLDKQALQLINRKQLGYSLGIAEKDYFLAMALKVLSESPLYRTLVFKGGTAIHHCYLPQSRFSEDLDFTSLDKSLTAEAVTAIFTPYPFFEVKKMFKSSATIKIERLKYSGVLDVPNSLKFEIDFVQNVVLPAKQLPYQNVWGIDVIVNVMDVREICAEKLRAMSDRARYRDFYDFYLLNQAHKIPLEDTLALVKQKEVRKPISTESILRNWKTASAQRHDEIDLVHYKHDIFKNDQGIGSFLNSLQFVTIKP